MSSTRHYTRLIALLKQTPPAAVLKAVEICDGHTIFTPRAFLDAGLPARVARVARCASRRALTLKISETGRGRAHGPMGCAGQCVPDSPP